jgi:hypothetical protein
MDCDARCWLLAAGGRVRTGCDVPFVVRLAAGFAQPGRLRQNGRMLLYRYSADGLEPVDRTSLAAEKIRERQGCSARCGSESMSWAMTCW